MRETNILQVTGIRSGLSEVYSPYINRVHQCVQPLFSGSRKDGKQRSKEAKKQARKR